MRALASIVATTALLAALAGCAPTIDAAVEKCAQTYMETLAQTQDGGLTADERKLALEDMREMCRSFVDDDPEAFMQQWG